MIQLNTIYSDKVNETWNGMLYWSENDLYVSSEENKPSTISKMVWQMGSQTSYDCQNGSPLQFRGAIANCC
uniref:Uncharacterized protein n=1 Tax=Romanomermis culicivorax TaxID=13658 RepID=A0A915I8I0_ROMCU